MNIFKKIVEGFFRSFNDCKDNEPKAFLKPSDDFGSLPIAKTIPIEEVEVKTPLTKRFVDRDILLTLLMQYLEDEEGYEVHFLKGERDITAFFGIYRYAHPLFSGWSWLDSVANNAHLIDYDLRDNKSTRIYLTEIIRSYHDKEYRKIARDFYEIEFFNPLRLYLFGRKSSLSAFSIAVNGGFGRFSIFIQEILNEAGANLRLDGYAGEKTFLALEQFDLGDEFLNKELISRMEKHYANLIRLDPKLYLRNKNGWANRLERLK